MSDFSASTEDYESSAGPRLSAALNCIRRGWPVVPLHDVAMGYCSCGDTSAKHMDKSAGKHPLANKWNQQALADEAHVSAMFGGRPTMNFGIKTGKDAGIWALDVDPKNGGDLALAELVKEHGALPDTYTQRTGSGGLHHLFSLPHDFTPTNSPGSLPPGLDVRGEGGFVVAAPCRSGSGLYEVLLDLPTVGAPAWLLEMIRPRVPADIEHKAALSHWDNPLVASQGGNDRLRRYAHAAAMAELTELQNAPQGRRGWTAHKVACSLIELINSPWAGLGEEVAREWFSVAAQRAMAQGGAFNQAEAWSAWGSAAKKIGARGRAAPDGPAGGVLIPWGELGGVPPFSPSSLSGQSVGAGLNGSHGTSQALDIGPADSQSPISGSVRSGDSGNSGNGANPAPETLSGVDLLKSHLKTGAQLAAEPPPEWLIRDWIPKQGFVQIIGKPGEGKSFVALDMALHLAHGREWHGQRVEKSRVAYMVAEGVAGMGQRYKAWCQKHNNKQDVDGIWFLPYPIQAADNAGWEVLMQLLVLLGIKTMIFDTQARVTVGVEENSSTEMGLFVHQVERLREQTGATAVLVHHLNKAGSSARGSNVILGALHTEITITKTANMVRAQVTKQKDAEEPRPLTFQLVSEKTGTMTIGGSLDVTSGMHIGGIVEDIWAGVLIGGDPVEAEAIKLTKAQGSLIALIAKVFANRGGTKAEIKSLATTGETKTMSPSTFYEAWDFIVAKRLVGRLVLDDKPSQQWVRARQDDVDSGFRLIFGEVDQ